MNKLQSFDAEKLVLSLRALKNWPADKAWYAATVIVIKKNRNLSQVVKALALGESYRNALKAGTWEPEVFAMWYFQKAKYGIAELAPALDSHA